MIKRFFSKIVDFAKRKPSLFIVIIIAIGSLFLYSTYLTLHLTSSSKFCGTCHVMNESGAGGEYNTWVKSQHATADIGCIDCHGAPGLLGYGKAKIGGLKDLYGEIFTSTETKLAYLNKSIDNLTYAKNLVPSDRCLYCHTTEVNNEIRDNTIMTFFGVNMRNMDDFKNPEYLKTMMLTDIYTEDVIYGPSPKHETHMKKVGLSCLTCHSEVAHAAEPKKLSITMQDCFTCHDSEREKGKFKNMPQNDNCVTCHTYTDKLQQGDLVPETEVPKQAWLMDGISCDSCHTTAFTRPTAKSCVTCHDDTYEEMSLMFTADHDIQLAELEQLKLMLQPFKSNLNKDDRANYDKFIYLMRFVEADGSRGIHNTFYTAEIYDAALTYGTSVKEVMDGYDQ